MNTENWLPIMGFEELYEVSDLGRVRSLPRRTTSGKVLSPGILRYGYHGYSLFKNNKRTNRTAHTLVLETFAGPRPTGMQVAHVNGVSSDNRLCNLTWKTAKDNQQDRFKHGTHLCGSRNPLAKLTTDKVSDIRMLSINGLSQRQLAKQFSVSQTTIRYVVSGRTWQSSRELI